MMFYKSTLCVLLGICSVVNQPLLSGTECDPPWVYHSAVRKCYLPVRGMFTFEQAWYGCVHLWNANVAMPMNWIENYVVNWLYTSTGFGPYWIGLRKIYGQWLWPINYPYGLPAYYTNWASGEPISSAGDTCTVVNLQNALAEWSARGCGQNWGETTGVVCQKEPNF